MTNTTKPPLSEVADRLVRDAMPATASDEFQKAMADSLDGGTGMIGVSADGVERIAPEEFRKPEAHSAEIHRKARELLAAEYERDGKKVFAPSELTFTPAEATYLRECIARDPRGLPSIGRLNEKLFALGGEYARYDPVPIPMILHCPCCGMQHVDAPKPCDMGVGCDTAGVCFAAANGEPGRCSSWENPPHRSHMCQYCRTVWRPADVPTTGVAAITTRGRDDTPAFATAGNRLLTERVATIGECASPSFRGDKQP